ncbi:MAG TPA: hypothetical protein VH500_04665 [Nitrososphaeraceae archaeon]
MDIGTRRFGDKFTLVLSPIFISVDNSTDSALTVYLNGIAINLTSNRDIPIINHKHCHRLWWTSARHSHV